MIALIIIVVILVVLGLMLMTTYNRLVGLRQNANQAFADIDVQLKQRQDLIPNLVETVKGYAAHESGTLEAVTAARAAAAGASNVQDRVQAENALTGALRQLFAVSAWALASTLPALTAAVRAAVTSSSVPRSCAA